MATTTGLVSNRFDAGCDLSSASSLSFTALLPPRAVSVFRERRDAPASSRFADHGNEDWRIMKSAIAAACSTAQVDAGTRFASGAAHTPCQRNRAASHRRLRNTLSSVGRILDSSNGQFSRAERGWLPPLKPRRNPPDPQLLCVRAKLVETGMTNRDVLAVGTSAGGVATLIFLARQVAGFGAGDGCDPRFGPAQGAPRRRIRAVGKSST